MNMRAMLLMLLVLGGGTACNAISGAKEIDFTSAPDGGRGGGGGGSSMSSSSSSGSGADAGNGTYDISCDPGSVIVGLYGQSGQWVDRIGLLCAPINGDGSLGPTSMTTTAGGDGGSPVTATCPTDQALVGIERWTNANPPLVYGIDLLCQTIPAWGMPNASTNHVKGVGANTGTVTGLACPPGTAHFNVQGEIGPLPNYTGTYVLTANFFCR